MLPVVTSEQMRVIDDSAPETLETLVGRAAWAVAREARHMLGGTYGRRVWVLAGPGNNGADGREAAQILGRWGVRCHVISALDPEVPPAGTEAPDLIIDAAFGTGLTRPYSPPSLPTVPVLAVDIPSGVNGLTGERLGQPMRAETTITFGAHKPGQLFGAGAELVGSIRLAGIGLDCTNTQTYWMTDHDLVSWPQRQSDSHKWKAAVRIVAGSAGMSGATALAAAGAFAAGAGYVGVLGQSTGLPIEAVQEQRPDRWGAVVAESSGRFGAVVAGPGMNPDATGDDEQDQLEQLLAVDRPLILDGGALAFLSDLRRLVADRTSCTVITPHDGEFERLMGHRPGADRISATRELAAGYRCVALLKGPTTCVADEHGDVRVVTAGDERLATAGSGDVLSGVIAAGLAQDLEPLDAASLGALLHGLAGSAGPAILTAGVLPSLVSAVLDRPRQVRT
jgi:NAD(P)H-hydrate epimerase